MDIHKLFFSLFLISELAVLYCNCQTSTLTPVNPDVIEGSDIDFVCTISSAVNYVNWLLSVDTATTSSIPMGVQNGACALSSSTSILSDTTKYSYTCTNTVYQVTVKNVQRSQHNNIWSCYPQGQSSGPTTTINVQVPVSSVSITPSSTTVDVIENTVGEFICQTSASRPDASATWYYVESGVTSQINQNITSSTTNDEFSVTTSTLRFVPSRQQVGVQINCRAENSVNTSPQQSSRITLNVLFPPMVNDMASIYQLEGSRLEFDCPYTVGFPTETTFKWSSGSQTWNTPKLSIQNVTKGDAGNYQCYVSNTMKPSGDSQSYTGSDAKSFYLNVLYKASITSFAIDGYSKKVVTVNERTPNIHFKCDVDSYPLSIITLKNSLSVLKSIISLTLGYTIESTTCLDSGIYTCSARNEHNDKNVPTETIQLFVNCSPRPTEDINQNITREMNQTNALTFNVIGYPVPTFTWWKLVQDKWIQLETNERYLVHSFDLKTVFVIYNLRLDDFTSYKVVAENNMGRFEQTYFLNYHENKCASASNCDCAASTSSVIGYSVGITSVCFLLIILMLVLVWRFRLQNADTNNRYVSESNNTKSNVEERTIETGFHGSLSTSQYDTLDVDNKEATNYSELDAATTDALQNKNEYENMRLQ